MISFSNTELYALIAGFVWPLTRILGLIATAPLFGNLSIPVRVKAALGVMLALVIAPTVPEVPASDPMSLAGALILAQQLVIGLAMGFSMRIVFAAVEMAGEVAGLTMGFGFATFFDPQTRGRSSAISQFLSLLALMIFLALNIHLVLLATLADSFVSMPISAAGDMKGFRDLANWGGLIFSAGAQLALPIIAALLITNIALGILTRAAPQLNLFGIGFPITLGAGFLVLALVLPYLSTPLERLFIEGLNVVRQFSLQPVR
ncbi:flagellar biosynthetic protein FliR [Noviherbaspirillum denitrificans]|uniref:Flagellar biosynthetic protein FliR n=1 Tax=Noviherbaspirillum denitrificans TaxID=1968433 RepID=A0A254T832_9BURK|nr:flagellar biosynthetic protein FliR [Noviherbaspirillum denitrificans]OWW18801.1 flagellar biosynthetic protein FliR [Noviherbaspirillum denitrificans]